MDMDPYFVINWKEEKIESEKAFGGGKTPRWNQTHELNVGTDLSSAGVMTFSFMEGDKLICSAQISVSCLV